MKIKYSNFNVIKKRGFYPKYKFTFSVDLDIKYNFYNNTQKRVWFDGNSDRFAHDFCSSINNKLLRDTNFWENVKLLGKNIKSEDECCISPDIEICNIYPVHDIILCHVLDNYEVLAYNFRKDDSSLKTRWDLRGLFINLQYEGYIKFKDEKYSYEYPIWLGDEVVETVCLNCKSIDTSEEQKQVQAFEDWLSCEAEKKERKERAKEICEGMYEN